MLNLDDVRRALGVPEVEGCELVAAFFAAGWFLSSWRLRRLRQQLDEAHDRILSMAVRICPNVAHRADGRAYCTRDDKDI